VVTPSICLCPNIVLLADGPLQPSAPTIHNVVQAGAVVAFQVVPVSVYKVDSLLPSLFLALPKNLANVHQPERIVRHQLPYPYPMHAKEVIPTVLALKNVVGLDVLFSVLILYLHHRLQNKDDAHAPDFPAVLVVKPPLRSYAHGAPAKVVMLLVLSIRNVVGMDVVINVLFLKLPHEPKVMTTLLLMYHSLRVMKLWLSKILILEFCRQKRQPIKCQVGPLPFV